MTGLTTYMKSGALSQLYSLHEPHGAEFPVFTTWHVRKYCYPSQVSVLRVKHLLFITDKKKSNLFGYRTSERNATPLRRSA